MALDRDDEYAFREREVKALETIAEAAAVFIAEQHAAALKRQPADPASTTVEPFPAEGTHEPKQSPPADSTPSAT